MPGRRGEGIALLADPTRRRIIALLAVNPLQPSVIASRIGLSRPATSRQLRLLRDAGLVRRLRFRVDGRSTLYDIEPRSLGPITAWLAGTDVGRPVRPRFDDERSGGSRSADASPIAVVPLVRNHRDL